ncbi:MAG: hypothetical protein H5T64_05570 [Chloroflexi bacterium]|nr:hypothetical protein [Chloroflexota bacterium]
MAKDWNNRIAKSESEGSSALSRAVLGRATAEAEQILADAQAKAERLRQEAHERAQGERKAILERALREADQIRKQAVITAQLQAQTMRLQRREGLLNQVFEEAHRKLASVQQWSNYRQIAEQLIREAVMSLNSDPIRISADAKTRSLLPETALAALAKDLKVQLEIGPELEHGTGIIAETTDGRQRYDNTLEIRLNRRWETIRAPVYRLLIGEHGS